jgi:hypothetical protein
MHTKWWSSTVRVAAGEEVDSASGGVTGKTLQAEPPLLDLSQS